jgi:hypothetical protein
MQIRIAVCIATFNIWYTGLFKMIVGVLATYHTQYTWDSSICIFLFNRTTLQVFITYRTGALYVHPLWFNIWYTGLFKRIVGVLTTCHTQYTWDRSICIFLFNRTTLQVFITYRTGALYVHHLWFNIWYTALFKMIVGILTTCHTQYTWDSSICIFLFNKKKTPSFDIYMF